MNLPEKQEVTVESQKKLSPEEQERIHFSINDLLSRLGL